MDYDAQAYETVVFAEVVSPTISALVPNWLSKITSPEEYQRSVEYIKSYQGQRVSPRQGASGMSTFEIDVYLEYRTRGEPVDLAEGACFELDMAARLAGAWGPDCVIERFTKLPKNGLPKVDGSNLYLYTPTRARTEEARFILSNGAGRKCEVIVTFHRPRAGSGREESDASDVMSPEIQVAKVDAGASAVQSDTDHGLLKTASATS